MYSFSYSYEGQVIHAVMERYIIDGYDRYRIEHDGGFCIIMASRRPNIFNKVIWVQIFKQGDRIEPQALIQAMGEGLAGAGISKLVKP
jgi:hypothetical protein